MSAAAVLNHVIDQGSTFSKEFAIKDPITLHYVSLANYNFRGQLRSTISDDVEAVALTFVKTVDDTVIMSLTAAQTDLLVMPKYVYDIEMFSASDVIVTKVLKGLFQVVPQVTR